MDIKKLIVDINPYKEGEWYDQGRYIGIVDTYPCEGDYIDKNYHFMDSFPKDNHAAKINKIFIEKIKKDIL